MPLEPTRPDTLGGLALGTDEGVGDMCPGLS